MLLQMTQSAEAHASWSPYRALLLLLVLVACLRDLTLAFGKLAAHLREAGHQAAPEAEPEEETEADDTAPLPLHPTQTRPRAAAEQTASRPRPQAAPAPAPETKKLPLPLWERVGERGRPAGTPQPATCHSTGLPPPDRPPKISAPAKPAPWHAHFITISVRQAKLAWSSR